MKERPIFESAPYKFRPLTKEEKRRLVACQELRYQNRDMVQEIMQKADIEPTRYDNIK